jgi:ATP-dependent Clp protease adaptor protein ClpS
MSLPSAAHDFVLQDRDLPGPRFRVVLLDDRDHTCDYVIEMLQRIFIATLDQACHHVDELDRIGRTVLMVCRLEEAQFARDQIQGYGRDWRLPRSAGPMTACVEPAV